MQTMNLQTLIHNDHQAYVERTLEVIRDSADKNPNETVGALTSIVLEMCDRMKRELIEAGVHA
jgi:hypothetical protein